MATRRRQVTRADIRSRAQAARGRSQPSPRRVWPNQRETVLDGHRPTLPSCLNGWVATTRRALIGAGFVGLLGALVSCSSTPTDPAPSPSLTPSPTPTPTPSLTPSQTPSGVDPLPPGVVNALIFGTDSRNPTSLTGNSDAIVLAQLSGDRTRLTLVSIARDSYVTIGRGKGKVNAAFARGGTPLLRETVSDLLGGLPIHLTAQANFNNFIALTRWLGGIRVVNRHASRVRVNSTGRVVVFPKGEILLKNTDGLIYARERKTLPLGDLDRAERHRAVITGMLRGLQSVANRKPEEFDALASNLIGNVKVTDFDPDRVGDLAAPLKRLDLGQVTSLMVPVSRFATINGASVDLVHEARNRELAEALKAGDVSGYVEKYGTGYTPRS